MRVSEYNSGAQFRHILCYLAHITKHGYMKNLIAALTLVLAGTAVQAQVVYETDVESWADVTVYVTDVESWADLVVYVTDVESWAGDNNGVWYFTDTEAWADISVFFTTTESWADLVICYTDVESWAGWKDESKKQLMIAD